MKYLNFIQGPLGFLKNIKNGFIIIEKPEENQTEFNSDLNEIVRGKWEHKSEEQKITI